MGVVYGVDFGTSNSSVVVGRPGRRIIRIRNPVESSYEVPSAVCLRRDGTMAVGSVARRMKLQRPSWYRDEFKRDIGSPIPHNFPAEDPDDPDQLPPEREYPVYQLVAEVLRLLREQAETQAPGDPDVVVLTVPAAWRDGNRDLMRHAAAMAGLPPAALRLITEPEAAAAYAVQEHLGLEERTLLVYDLGGGTFDCALVRGRGGVGFEPIGEPGGLENMGGILFDQQILSLIRERHPDRTGELLQGPPRDVRTLARRLQLRDTCENVKRVLSSEERYEGLLTELGPDVDFVLTRGELAERLAPLLDETLAECERLLRTQGLDWGDVDGVVPVGGSVRLPMVGEAIARRASRHGTSVQRVDDPELAVAHGAALHGFRLVSGAGARGGTTGGTRRAQTGTRESPSRIGGPRLPDAASTTTEASVAPAPAAPAQVAPPTSLVTGTAGEPPVPDRVPAPTTSEPKAEDAGQGDSGDAEPDVFYARHSRRITRIHTWDRASGYLLFLAGVILLAESLGAGSVLMLSKTVLSVVVTTMTCLSAAALLVSASAMRKMLIGVGGAVACAVFLTGAALTHYLLGGWVNVVIVLVLLFFAFVTFGIAGLGVPLRGTYVLRLTIAQKGMTFLFDKGPLRELEWQDISALFIEGSGLNRKLFMRLRPGVPTYPFLPKSGGGTADEPRDESIRALFNAYHFDDGDAVLARIQEHSGGLLTDSW